jgi:hypothetical protein
MNHPAHILYVKNCVSSATGAHGSHEFGAKKQPGGVAPPGEGRRRKKFVKTGITIIF